MGLYFHDFFAIVKNAKLKTCKIKYKVVFCLQLDGPNCITGGGGGL